MTRKYLFKTLAVLLVTAFMAAPVMGSVCTMACGDSGSCCCSGEADGGALSLESPNCCGGELESSSRDITSSDRSVSTARSGQAMAAAPDFVSALAAADPPDESGRPAPLRVYRPPQSQLFILNASFLI